MTSTGMGTRRTAVRTTSRGTRSAATTARRPSGPVEVRPPEATDRAWGHHLEVNRIRRTLGLPNLPFGTWPDGRRKLPHQLEPRERTDEERPRYDSGW
jgi:hypothetical protein